LIIDHSRSLNFGMLASGADGWLLFGEIPSPDVFYQSQRRDRMPQDCNTRLAGKKAVSTAKPRSERRAAVPHRQPCKPDTSHRVLGSQARVSESRASAAESVELTAMAACLLSIEQVLGSVSCRIRTSEMASIDVEDVLSKLTEREKISLLAGTPSQSNSSMTAFCVSDHNYQVSTSGTRNPFPNMASHLYDFLMVLMVFAALASSTASQQLAFPAEAGRLMGKEAVAKGAHVILGPTINMQRSPLGGRGFESIGEDPFLAGLGSAALVKGMQENGVVATIKHFVGNDQEHERNRVDSIVTERALREIYLMPFQLAVRDAYPKSFMTAYNKINGTHVSENTRILKDILRGEWGWRGLVMSDWFGVYSTSKSIIAGLDLEMPGPTRFRGEALIHAATANKIPAGVIDDRARQVLELVNECAASGVKENAEETTNDTPETSKLLRRLAAESIVLMKNEGNVLPLKKDKKILIIGPNAKAATYCGGGSASLRPYYAVTPYEGIVNKVGEKNVDFSIGAYSHKEMPSLGIDWRTTADEDGERGVLFKAYNEPPEDKNRKCVDVLGPFTNTSMMFMDYKNPKLKSGLWYADLEAYFTADRDGEYELGVCVYGSAKVFINNELVLDVTEKQRQGSAFFGLGTEEDICAVPMKKGQTYKVRLEFGSAPTSKLTGGTVDFGGGAVRIGGAWKIDADEEVRRAAELAKSVDQVLVCAGLNMDWESEGFDRPDMKLPGHLDRLISAVAEANPRTAVVIQSGTPVEMPWLSKVPALLQAWYGGNETGNGVADVVFGDVNPCGKTSLSFPIRNEDNPAFLNYRSEAGRVLYGEDVYVGYRYYDTLSRPVAFPFGHGLSYSTFSFSGLKLESPSDSEGNFIARVTVRNTGKVAGAQVAQLYISPLSPSIRRPTKELKAFTKVYLEAGEEKTVELKVALKYATSFWDESRNAWLSEKGKYKAIVSDSSAASKSANHSLIGLSFIYHATLLNINQDSEVVAFSMNALVSRILLSCCKVNTHAQYLRCRGHCTISIEPLFATESKNSSAVKNVSALVVHLALLLDHLYQLLFNLFDLVVFQNIRDPSDSRVATGAPTVSSCTSLNPAFFNKKYGENSSTLQDTMSFLQRLWWIVGHEQHKVGNDVGDRVIKQGT
ncbi:glycoside hydrolase family 3 protein, partial [Aureobasidium melanogenum]